MPSLFLPLARVPALAPVSDNVAYLALGLWHLTPEGRDRRKPHFSLPERRVQSNSRSGGDDRGTRETLSILDTAAWSSPEASRRMPSAFVCAVSSASM